MEGLPLEHLSFLMSSGPAQVLGLDAHKGQLAPGYDADVVLVDLDSLYTVNAEALHRVIVVASSTLDSTPQSGFVCNILNFSHTTHRQGYWHVCVVSVIAPIIETLLLIPLCTLFGL